LKSRFSLQFKPTKHQESHPITARATTERASYQTCTGNNQIQMTKPVFDSKPKKWKQEQSATNQKALFKPLDM
jgi:hypothetical protein